jgi:SAM-dependent methyltransferase
VLDRLLLSRLPTGAHILDLCCGTGRIAGQLVERGYRVTGVDSSQGMLDLARRNVPAARVLLADARSFTIPEPADAAISTSDSLNHVTEPDGLAAVFACVHRALRAGAPFVFDLNTEAKYRLRWTGSFGIAEEDHACVVRATYDEEACLARFDATTFVPSDNGQAGWKREDLTIMERYYSEPTIRETLMTAGFDEIVFYDWQRDLDPDGEPEKFFVVCRRA